MRISALFATVVVASILACTGGAATSDGSSPPDAGNGDGSIPALDTMPKAPMTGANGIEKTCPPASPAPPPLTAAYSSPDISIVYPTTWSKSAASSNTVSLTRSYAYVPTGATAPKTESAYVALSSPRTATSTSEVQRMLDETVSGYPNAVVRRFDILGTPAIAWRNQAPPPQAGCAGCLGDPGPDIVTIGVVTAHGLNVVILTGAARLDAPEDVFCDIQAILVSITLPR